MKLVCLLLCILSVTSARVHPRTEVNDDLNGVEGVMVDIPEYEDPEVSLFKLIARGVMPVYTFRGAVKDSKVASVKSLLSEKNDTPPYQTDDIKKGLDTVIIQLQEAKNKLENGSAATIYFDIDKSLLSLEDLKHQLLVHRHNVSTERLSFDNASTGQPLIINASTENPFVTIETSMVDGDFWRVTYTHELPPEFSSYEKEVKTDVVDDASSAEVDQVEQEDKTLIRKKWLYKLSGKV